MTIYWLLWFSRG